MTTAFARLATANDLELRDGVSSDGLVEKYLYSRDMVYRYAFGRWWGAPDLATTAVWVLLNPATGDTERRARPTLARCISRSRAAGSTGLVIVNLFAYRDTDPRNLKLAFDAVGPANDEVLGSSPPRGNKRSLPGARTANCTGAPLGSVCCWIRQCVWERRSGASRAIRSTFPRMPP